ncbi:MAG TPA: GH92 family glycosyl hydrolase [Terracidiphilus sp.]|jgi:predicted alpha-1,2-mannosidase
MGSVRKALQVVLLCIGLVALAAHAQVGSVDPTIGNIAILLAPTRPTVYLPNSMVRVYPVRDDGAADQIQFFPLTINGHRGAELFSIMPGDGSPAAYDQEITTPYFYATRFNDLGATVEFTATERCGFFRFGFAHGPAKLVVSDLTAGKIRVHDGNIVEGEERFDGMAAYVYGVFSKPVQAAEDQHGTTPRVLVSADAGPLEFRYGISFISSEQAKSNLEHEAGSRSFEDLRDAAKARWNDTLGRIVVEGGTESQRRVFYTALYRSSERMINITEDGRYYSGFDHEVHTDARPFYVDNWLWDTYRALEPLQTLLHPGMEADKLQSYVRMYQQGGIMPTFNEVTGPVACMNGNHSAPWFADAWFKGVRNFDLATAYEGIRKRSLDSTLLPWRLGTKSPLDDFYNTHGYMPALRPGEKESYPQVHPFEKRQPVPVTLGNSFDDWAIAQIARELQKPQDEALFLKRAGYYRNLFRTDKAMMWPKDEAGLWIEPLDPKFSGGMGGRDYYDENNGYTYTWDVNHDYAGLIELMGGPQKAEAHLDQLFREPLGRSRYEFQGKFPDSTSMVGQFSMGNEPSFAIPYIYDRVGAPWKTQLRVRMLLDTFFKDTLQGIPGDEDGGGMSAFVVFSMMGFYPVTPGIPVYDIASPVFEKVTIHLENGKDFVILAPGASRQNKYVEKVVLNGKPLDRVWFHHADIAQGGVLELTMGDAPNKSLGAASSSFPPDKISIHPEDYK